MVFFLIRNLNIVFLYHYDERMLSWVFLKAKTHSWYDVRRPIYRLKELDVCDCCHMPARLSAIASNVAGSWQQCCRHMAATTQIKMFKPNKHGSMTVKVMSYRVLRQHILRFGYVRIKRRNESVINISGETKKFRCILQNNSFTSATELTILTRVSSSLYQF